MLLVFILKGSCESKRKPVLMSKKIVVCDIVLLTKCGTLLFEFLLSNIMGE